MSMSELGQKNSDIGSNIESGIVIMLLVFLIVGKPARWSFDKEIQDFKIGISCHMEKKEAGRKSGTANMAIFAGDQRQGVQKKEVKYRRLGDGAGGTTIRKGLRKAVSVIW